jgi:hypothetical protein
MMAEVIPEAIAIGRKAALMPCRCGRPKEMLEAPQLVFTFSSSRSRRTRANTCLPAGAHRADRHHERIDNDCRAA